MPERNLYYDNLVSRFEKLDDEARILRINNAKLPEEAREVIDQNVYIFRTLKDEAKVFWIDELTLESLLNEPYNITDFTKFNNRFPFPVMFIDFQKSLEYRLLEKREENTKERIGGLLFCNLKNDYSHEEEIIENISGFTVSAFGCNNEGAFIKLINLNSNSMIIGEEGTGNSERRIYHLNKQNKKLIRLAKINHNEDFIKSLKEGSLENKFNAYDLNYQMIDDDCLDAFKLANLTINTIDYINAQNIVIRERRRFREEHERVGTGKERHLEKRKHELKPYYWIEIKKEHADVEEKGEWTLQYRVWVRGHNRHYQDGREVWIQEYVKGPPKAPWKNNKYELLFNNFKHILKNPKYKEG